MFGMSALADITLDMHYIRGLYVGTLTLNLNVHRSVTYTL